MGVNLLPFIDRDRLIKAMHSADQNGNLLTKNE
jgi:5'-3' exonuclease